MDNYTKVEHRGLLTRIKESIGGLLIGLLMFLVSFPLLFWNEGRAVDRAQDLEAGRSAVVSVEAGKSDPGNDGELVHLSGTAKPDGAATDPVLGVERDAVRLVRTVEMYQWKEKTEKKTKKKVGGGEEVVTRYKYNRTWEDDLIDSSRFEIQRGHQNPGSMPYESDDFRADAVHLETFELSDELVGKMSSTDKVELTEQDLQALPDGLASRAKLSGGTAYVGDPSHPRVGDLRISYAAAQPADVTIVAGQDRTKLVPFHSENMEGDITLLEYGTLSADEMFEQAEADNAFLTWLLRIVGFLLMFIGLSLMLKPLSVVADVIPFVGSIIGFGTTLAAAFVSFGLSLLVISIAWIFYRPLVAIVLLALAGAVVGAFVVLTKKRAAATA